MNGLFLIDRSMLDHHIVGMQNKDRFCMWVWMLSAARWKPHRIFVQGKEITLQRGQLFVSLRSFAKENNVTKGVAERFVRDLKSGTMIETANETGGTIVTICNYEIYQDLSTYRRTANETANRTATGQRQDIKEHQRTPEETPDMFLGDEPPPKKKAKRASSLPENWVPSDENTDHAREQGLTQEQIKSQGDKFRDYHLAKGSTSKDWNAAWRTWIRNSKQFEKPANGPRVAGSATTSEIADRGARWAEGRASRRGTGGNS